MITTQTYGPKKSTSPLLPFDQLAAAVRRYARSREDYVGPLATYAKGTRPCAKIEVTNANGAREIWLSGKGQPVGMLFIQVLFVNTGQAQLRIRGESDFTVNLGVGQGITESGVQIRLLKTVPPVY